MFDGRAARKLKAYYTAKANTDRTPTGLPFLRASGIGKCIREIAYRFVGTPVAQLNWRDYTPMYWGTVMHRQLQEDLVEAGLKLEHCEVTLKKTYNVKFNVPSKQTKPKKTSFKVVGHQDGQYPDKTNKSRLLEIKTFGDWRYKAFARSVYAVPMTTQREFYRETCQSQVYMDMGEHSSTEILGVNRSNGAMLSYYEGKDSGLLNERILQIGWVLIKLKENKKWLPRRPHKPQEVICKICEFRHTCHGEAAQEMNREI